MADDQPAPNGGDAFLAADSEESLLAALGADDGDDDIPIDEAPPEVEPPARGSPTRAQEAATDAPPAWAVALQEQTQASQRVFADALTKLSEAMSRIGQPAPAPAPSAPDALDLARKGDWSALLREGLGHDDAEVQEAAALNRLRSRYQDQPELLSQIDASERRALEKLSSSRALQAANERIAKLEQALESDRLAREFPRRLRDNRIALAEQWPTLSEIIEPQSTAVSDYIASRVGFHDRDAVTAEMARLETQLARVDKAMAAEPGEAERMARYLALQSPELEPFFSSLAEKHKAAPAAGAQQPRAGKQRPPRTSTVQSSSGAAPAATTDIEKFHNAANDRDFLGLLSRPVPGEMN